MDLLSGDSGTALLIAQLSLVKDSVTLVFWGGSTEGKDRPLKGSEVGEHAFHVGNKQKRHFGIEGGTPVIKSIVSVPSFNDKSS